MTFYRKYFFWLIAYWKQVIDYMRGVRAQFKIGTLELRSSNQGSFRSNQKKFSNSSKNDPVAPKFDAVVQDITDYMEMKSRENKDGLLPQQIIYSRFLENGVNPIYKRLKYLKYRIGLTTGDNTKERDNLFESYNKGDINILAMSSIGGQGLTFYNTDRVYIMDGFENDASRNQMMYRVSRIGASTKRDCNGNFLPITVITYVSVFPKIWKKEEADSLLQFFIDNHWTGANPEHVKECIGDGNEFMTLLLEKVQKEENFKTVDQILLESCTIKSEILKPIVDRIAALGLRE